MMQNKRINTNITFDDEVTLIKQKSTKVDKYGNLIIEEEKNIIMCNKISASRDEFYRASQNDLKVNFILTIHEFEYEGESLLEFNNKRYSIVRTYENGKLLELVIGDKIGNES